MSVTILNASLSNNLAVAANQYAYCQALVNACGPTPSFVARQWPNQLRVWTINPPSVSNDAVRRVAFDDAYLAVTDTPANLPALADILVLRDSNNVELVEFTGAFARQLRGGISGDGFSGALFAAPAALPYGTPVALGLTAINVVPIGTFKIPANADGFDMTYCSGGLSLKIGGANPELYLLGGRATAGNNYTVRCALIRVPTVLAAPANGNLASVPEATVIQATGDALDGPASRIFSANAANSSANGINMLGVGYDASTNKLIISVAAFYGEAPQNEFAGTIFVRSADLTATGTTVGPAKIGPDHPRATAGPLTKIPASLVAQWSVRPWASGGSAGLSVAATIANGPDLRCFDPADIVSAGQTIDENKLAAYYWSATPALRKTFSHAMGSGFDAISYNSPAESGVKHFYKNDYWDWSSHLRGGPVFFPTRGVVVYFGAWGAGRNFYSTQNDPNISTMIWSVGGATSAAPLPVVDPNNQSGGAPRGWPYERKAIVIPLTEYAAVLAGSKLPSAVAASNTFAMPAHPFAVNRSGWLSTSGAPLDMDVGEEHTGFTCVGTALDDTVTPPRLYELYGGSVNLSGSNGESIVRVYEIT